MRSLGLNGNTVNLLAAGGISVVQLLAVFPAIWYIDSWGEWIATRHFISGSNFLFWIGRKPLLRGGSAAMTTSHLLIALLVRPPHLLFMMSAPITIYRSSNSAVSGKSVRSPLGLPLGTICHGSASYNALTRLSSGVYVFTVAYGVSFGPIGWVLPNEVFPLSMRGKGAALSTASNWTNNCTSQTDRSTSGLLTDDDVLSPDWPHYAATD